MKFKGFKTIALVLLVIATQASHAATKDPLLLDKDGLMPFIPSYVLTFSAGPVWQDAGKTQTFYLTPAIEKTYVANKSTRSLAEGELFLGVQRGLPYQLQGQLGIAALVTGNARLSGYIWDDADPQFNNYTYSYRVQHTHIALKGKLLADRGYPVIPWISGSLGVGFNRAHDFDNIPTIFEAIQNPNFGSHTKTAFTYTLGAGIQKAINESTQVGIGYEFADWGKSRLNQALGQSLNTGLGLNHLYTNGVLVNITYLA